MEISWLGHACFQIKGSQKTVICDPYSPELGYTLGKRTADIVTISHQHPGHSYVQGVDGDPRVVSGPGEYEIGGVLIIGAAAYHDGEKGAERGKNTVYVMHIDDISVCHLGDLGHKLTAGQLEEIGEVDVLFLPVGGVSTIDAPAAAEVMRQLEPRVVLPMHYQTPALNRTLEPVERFFKEMSVSQVEPQPKLSVSRSSLPASAQIVYLSY